MKNRMRVLITGHRGYIGSVMAPYLARNGYDVVGLDTDFFGECTLVPDPIRVPEIRKDIRDIVPGDLDGMDAVIHLAALSNDPIGNLDEEWTADINFRASVRLAELAREAGVKRFLFSSSCIMYGMSEAAVVDETSPLDPKTTYARSKVMSERAIAELASDDFSPVFIRNGTIYGVSPRMRFDTVLNDLTGAAYTTGTVVVKGNGKPWRPVLHVEDVARTFERFLEAPLADVHNQAFNNGADHLNYQVLDLAEAAARTVPGCRVNVLDGEDADRRTYRASFAKFAMTFPDFEFRWNAQMGAEELARTFKLMGLTEEMYRSPSFTRLRWLRQLLSEGRLDGSLRWREAAEVTA